jgi:DNA-binding CsgD family transcriptional regulator
MPAAVPFGRVTPRQAQALRCAADDLTHKQAARKLGVEPSAVRGLNQRAREALGARTIAGAVAEALRRGLIA